VQRPTQVEFRAACRAGKAIAISACAAKLLRRLISSVNSLSRRFCPQAAKARPRAIKKIAPRQGLRRGKVFEREAISLRALPISGAQRYVYCIRIEQELIVADRAGFQHTLTVFQGIVYPASLGESAGERTCYARTHKAMADTFADRQSCIQMPGSVIAPAFHQIQFSLI
jgi:hypothetical protein